MVETVSVPERAPASNTAPSAPLSMATGGMVATRRVRTTRGGGSTYEVVSGARRVKGYPITRDELTALSGTGLLATVCFSIGGTYVNRSYEIQRDLELTQGVSTKLRARWEAKEADAWTFGLIMLVIGTLLVIAGGAKIWSVIWSTEHPQ
jgi:hypothetical protein